MNHQYNFFADQIAFSKTGFVPAVVVYASFFGLFILVAGFFSSIASFCVSQLRTIFQLYARRVPLTIEDLHEYTKSVLANRAPEFENLKKLSAVNSKASLLKAREILGNVSTTIELFETGAIRAQLLSEFKRLDQDFLRRLKICGGTSAKS